MILNHAIGSKISPASRISISSPCRWTIGGCPTTWRNNRAAFGRSLSRQNPILCESVQKKKKKRYMILRYSTSLMQAVRRRYCLGTLCGADNATPRTDLAGHAALRASDTLSDVALRSSNPGAEEMLAATSYLVHSGDHSVIDVHKQGLNSSLTYIQVHSVTGYMGLEHAWHETAS